MFESWSVSFSFSWSVSSSRASFATCSTSCFDIFMMKTPFCRRGRRDHRERQNLSAAKERKERKELKKTKFIISVHFFEFFASPRGAHFWSFAAIPGIDNTECFPPCPLWLTVK